MSLANFGRCLVSSTNNISRLIKLSSYISKPPHNVPLLSVFQRHSSSAIPDIEPTTSSCTTPPNKTVTPSQVYEKVEDLIEITKGDPELERKLRVLCLEYDVMKQEGAQVPSTLKLVQWQNLFEMETRSKRSKYYRFLFVTEMKKSNEKAKKEIRSAGALERKELKRKETLENEHLNYGLNWNTFLLRVYDTTINHMYNNRLIQAMQFGQKIVFDCDYDSNMSIQESTNCAKQLNISYALNRVHDDPYDIYLCNARNDGNTMHQLKKIIPNLHEDHFPLNVSEKSYLDLFPKEKLVYLTPHCRTDLQEFDHDAVYIIGALVDKRNSEPLSLAKAKREGLRMAKFPLDHYLQWGDGSGKSLTLNQVIHVMLDLKMKDDWEYALRHVPRRKLFQADAFTSQPRQKKKFDREQAAWGTDRISDNSDRGRPARNTSGGETPVRRERPVWGRDGIQESSVVQTDAAEETPVRRERPVRGRDGVVDNREQKQEGGGRIVRNNLEHQQWINNHRKVINPKPFTPVKY